MSGSFVSVGAGATETVSSGSALQINTSVLNLGSTGSGATINSTPGISVNSGASLTVVSGSGATSTLQTGGTNVLFNQAAGSSLSFNSSAGGQASLRLIGAGLTASTSGAANLSINNTAVTAGGAISLSATGTGVIGLTAGGTLNSSNNSIDLSAQRLDWSTAISATVLNAGSGNVTLSPNSSTAITIGSASKQSGFDLTSSELNAISAAGVVVGSLAVGGGLSSTGNITSPYNLSLLNQGAINTSGFSINIGANTLTVNSSASTVASGAVSGTSGQALISSSGALAVNGAISFSAAGTVNLSTSNAGSDVNLAASVGGGTSAVTVSAAGAGNIRQAAGQISGSSASLTSAGGNITDASGSAALVTNVSALAANTTGTGNVILSNASALNLNNSSAGNNFTLSAGGSIGFNAGQTLNAPNVNLSTTAANGNIAAQGITAPSSLSLTTNGSGAISVATGQSISSNSVFIDTQNLSINGTITATAAGSVTLQRTGGTINISNSGAGAQLVNVTGGGGSITIGLAGNGVAFTAGAATLSLDPGVGGSTSINGSSILLGASHSVSVLNGALAVNTQTLNLQNGSTLSALGNINLSGAGSALAIQANGAAGAVTATISSGTGQVSAVQGAGNAISFALSGGASSGTINIDGGPVAFSTNGANISVAANTTLASNNSLSFNVAGASAFNNSGTVSTSGAASNISVTADVLNYVGGQLIAGSGAATVTLSPSSNGVTMSIGSPSKGAGFDLTATEIQSNTSASQLIVGNASAGTLTLNGNLNVAGKFNLDLLSGSNYQSSGANSFTIGNQTVNVNVAGSINTGSGLLSLNAGVLNLNSGAGQSVTIGTGGSTMSGAAVITVNSGAGVVVTGNMLASSANLGTINLNGGNNGTIALNANLGTGAGSASNVNIVALGSGAVTQSSGKTVQANAVSIQVGSGNIGDFVGPNAINVSAGNSLSLQTAGGSDANVANNSAAAPLLLNNSGVWNSFKVSSNGAITNNNNITAGTLADVEASSALSLGASVITAPTVLLQAGNSTIDAGNLNVSASNSLTLRTIGAAGQILVGAGKTFQSKTIIIDTATLNNAGTIQSTGAGGSITVTDSSGDLNISGGGALNFLGASSGAITVGASSGNVTFSGNQSFSSGAASAITFNATNLALGTNTVNFGTASAINIQSSAGLNITAANGSATLASSGASFNVQAAAGSNLNFSASSGATVINFTGAALKTSSSGGGSSFVNSNVSLLSDNNIQMNVNGGGALTNNGSISSSKNGGSIQVLSDAALSLAGTGTIQFTGGNSGAISVDANSGASALNFNGSQTFNPGAAGSTTWSGSSVSVAGALTELVSSGSALAINTPSLLLGSTGSGATINSNAGISVSSAAGLVVTSGSGATSTLQTGGAAVNFNPAAGANLSFLSSGLGQSTITLVGGGLTAGTSGAGNLIVNNTALNSPSAISLTAAGSGTIQLTGNAVLHSTNAPINLSAQRIDFSTATSATTLNAGSGVVTLAPVAPIAITVGSAVKQAGFDISSAELGKISASQVVVGSSTIAGGVTTNGNIDVSSLYSLTLLNQGAVDTHSFAMNAGANTITLTSSAAGVNLGSVSGTTGQLIVNSSSNLALSQAINFTAGIVNLNTTTAGSSVSLAANVNVGTGTVVIIAAGAGDITQSAGTISAQNASFGSSGGHISDSAGTGALQTNVSNLSANTNGAGFVILNDATAVNLNNSSAGSSFTLSAAGNISFNPLQSITAPVVNLFTTAANGSIVTQGINAANALTLTTNGTGSVVISTGQTVSSNAITIDTQNLTINGTLTATGAGSISLSRTAGTINIGNSLGAQLINVVGGAGTITIGSGGSGVNFNGAASTLNIDPGAGGNTTIQGSSVQLAANSSIAILNSNTAVTTQTLTLGNASNITSTSNLNISGGASALAIRAFAAAGSPTATISSSAGNISIAQAAGQSLTFGTAGGALTGQINLNAPTQMSTSAANITVQAGTTLSSNNALTATLAGANFNNNGTVVQTNAAAALTINANGATVANTGSLSSAGTLSILSNANLNLTNSAAANITATGATLIQSSGVGSALSVVNNNTISGGSVNIRNIGAASSTDLSGNGSLSSTGAVGNNTSVSATATLTLSGQSYSSANGQVNLAGNNVVLAAASTETVSGGAAVSIQTSNLLLNNNSNFNASGASAISINSAAGSLTVTAPGAGNVANLQTTGGSFSITPAAGQTLDLSGAGTVNFNGGPLSTSATGAAGSNFAAGLILKSDSGITVNSATGIVSNAASISTSAAASITVNVNGGTLNNSGSFSSASNLNINSNAGMSVNNNGGTLSSAAAMTMQNTGAAAFTFSNTGTASSTGALNILSSGNLGFSNNAGSISSAASSVINIQSTGAAATVTFASPASLIAGGTLSVQSTGAGGAVTMNGASALQSNTGAISLNANAALTFNGSNTFNASTSVALAGASIGLAAGSTQTVSGGLPLGVTANTINFGNNSKIVGSGASAITVGSTGSLTINGPGAANSATISSASGSILLQPAAGSDLNLSGAGTLNLNGSAATLSTSGAGSITNALTLASDHALTVTTSGSLNNNGVLRTSAAQNIVLNLNNGTLNNNGTVNSAGTLSLSSTGAMTVNNNAAAAMISTGAMSLTGAAGLLSVSNSGNMQSGSNLAISSAGDLTFTNNAVGTVSSLAGGTIVIQSTGNAATVNLSNSGSLVSDGAFSAIASGAASAINTLGAAAISSNTGSINLSANGALNLNSSRGYSAPAAQAVNFTGGSITFAGATTQTVSNGNTINLNAAAVNFSSASKLNATGASAVNFVSSGALTVNGPGAGNSANVSTLAAISLQPAAGSSLSFNGAGSLAFSGSSVTGTVSGAGNISVQYSVSSNNVLTLNVASGTLNNAGSLSTTAAGADLNLNINGGVLSNSGSISSNNNLNAISTSSLSLNNNGGSISAVGAMTVRSTGGNLTVNQAAGSSLSANGAVLIETQNANNSLQLTNAGNIQSLGSSTTIQTGGNAATLTLANAGSIQSSADLFVQTTSTAGINLNAVGGGTLSSSSGNLNLLSGSTLVFNASQTFSALNAAKVVNITAATSITGNAATETITGGNQVNFSSPAYTLNNNFVVFASGASNIQFKGTGSGFSVTGPGAGNNATLQSTGGAINFSPSVGNPVAFNGQGVINLSGADSFITETGAAASIAPGLTLAATNKLNVTVSGAGSSLTNSGVLQAGALGLTLALTNTTASSTGIIRANGGGNVNLSLLGSTLTNIGSVLTVGGGDILAAADGGATLADMGTINSSGNFTLSSASTATMSFGNNSFLTANNVSLGSTGTLNIAVNGPASSIVTINSTSMNIQAGAALNFSAAAVSTLNLNGSAVNVSSTGAVDVGANLTVASNNNQTWTVNGGNSIFLGGVISSSLASGTILIRSTVGDLTVDGSAGGGVAMSTVNPGNTIIVSSAGDLNLNGSVSYSSEPAATAGGSVNFTSPSMITVMANAAHSANNPTALNVSTPVLTLQDISSLTGQGSSTMTITSPGTSPLVIQGASGVNATIGTGAGGTTKITTTDISQTVSFHNTDGFSPDFILTINGSGVTLGSVGGSKPIIEDFVTVFVVNSVSTPAGIDIRPQGALITLAPYIYVGSNLIVSGTLAGSSVDISNCAGCDLTISSAAGTKGTISAILGDINIHSTQGLTFTTTTPGTPSNLVLDVRSNTNSATISSATGLTVSPDIALTVQNNSSPTTAENLTINVPAQTLTNNGYISASGNVIVNADNGAILNIGTGPIVVGSKTFNTGSIVAGVAGVAHNNSLTINSSADLDMISSNGTNQVLGTGINTININVSGNLNLSNSRSLSVGNNPSSSVNFNVGTLNALANVVTTADAPLNINATTINLSNGASFNSISGAGGGSGITVSTAGADVAVNIANGASSSFNTNGGNISFVPASGQSVVMSGNGTINLNGGASFIQAQGSGNATISAGTTVSASQNISLAGQSGTFTNDGIISNTTGNFSAQWDGGTIVNTGTISTPGSLNFASSASPGLTVTNSGTLSSGATASFQVTGPNSTLTINNINGLISAPGAVDFTAVGASSNVNFNGGGTSKVSSGSVISMSATKDLALNETTTFNDNADFTLSAGASVSVSNIVSGTQTINGSAVVNITAPTIVFGTGGNIVNTVAGSTINLSDGGPSGLNLSVLGAATIDSSGGTINIQPSVAGQNLDISGGGALNLLATNSNLSVQNGATLNVGPGSSVVASGPMSVVANSGFVQVGAGGSLQSSGALSVSSDSALQLSGTGSLNSISSSVQVSSGPGGALTVGSSMTYSAAAGQSVNLQSDTSIDFAAGSTQTVTGTANFNVNAPVINFNSGAGITGGGGQINLNNPLGALSVNAGGAVQTINSGAGSLNIGALAGNDVNLGGTGTLNLNGAAVVISSTGAGNTNLAAGLTVASNNQITMNSASSINIDGSLSSSAGKNIVLNSGVLNDNGSISAGGNLTVNPASDLVVSMGDGSSLGASGTVSLSPVGSLQINLAAGAETFSTGSTFTVSSKAGSALSFVNSNVPSGAANLSLTGVLNVSSGGDTTVGVSTAISSTGNQSWTQAGGHTFTFDGSISTSKVGGSVSIASTTGDLTLTGIGSVSFSSNAAGNNISVSSSANLNLTGNNSFVTEGGLAAGGSVGFSGNTSINLGAGAAENILNKSTVNVSTPLLNLGNGSSLTAVLASTVNVTAAPGNNLVVQGASNTSATLGAGAGGQVNINTSGAATGVSILNSSGTAPNFVLNLTGSSTTLGAPGTLAPVIGSNVTVNAVALQTPNGLTTGAASSLVMSGAYQFQGSSLSLGGKLQAASITVNSCAGCDLTVQSEAGAGSQLITTAGNLNISSTNALNFVSTTPGTASNLILDLRSAGTSANITANTGNVGASLSVSKDMALTASNTASPLTRVNLNIVDNNSIFNNSGFVSATGNIAMTLNNSTLNNSGFGTITVGASNFATGTIVSGINGAAAGSSVTATSNAGLIVGGNGAGTIQALGNGADSVNISATGGVLNLNASQVYNAGSKAGAAVNFTASGGISTASNVVSSTGASSAPINISSPSLNMADGSAFNTTAAAGNGIVIQNLVAGGVSITVANNGAASFSTGGAAVKIDTTAVAGQPIAFVGNASTLNVSGGALNLGTAGGVVSVSPGMTVTAARDVNLSYTNGGTFTNNGVLTSSKGSVSVVQVAGANPIDVTAIGSINASTGITFNAGNAALNLQGAGTMSAGNGQLVTLQGTAVGGNFGLNVNGGSNLAFSAGQVNLGAGSTISVASSAANAISFDANGNAAGMTIQVTGSGTSTLSTSAGGGINIAPGGTGAVTFDAANAGDKLQINNAALVVTVQNSGAAGVTVTGNTTLASNNDMTFNLNSSGAGVSTLTNSGTIQSSKAGGTITVASNHNFNVTSGATVGTIGNDSSANNPLNVTISTSDANGIVSILSSQNISSNTVAGNGSTVTVNAPNLQIYNAGTNLNISADPSKAINLNSQNVTVNGAAVTVTSNNGEPINVGSGASLTLSDTVGTGSLNFVGGSANLNANGGGFTISGGLTVNSNSNLNIVARAVDFNGGVINLSSAPAGKGILTIAPDAGASNLAITIGSAGPGAAGFDVSQNELANITANTLSVGSFNANTGSLIVTGVINAGGAPNSAPGIYNVILSAGGNISQSVQTNVITTGDLTVQSSGGSVATIAAPLQVNVSTLRFDAPSSAANVIVNNQGVTDLTVAAPLGSTSARVGTDLNIQAQGNILTAAGNQVVFTNATAGASSATLSSATGSIGDLLGGNPFNIQSLVPVLLSASAVTPGARIDLQAANGIVNNGINSNLDALIITPSLELNGKSIAAANGNLTLQSMSGGDLTVTNAVGGGQLAANLINFVASNKANVSASILNGAVAGTSGTDFILNVDNTPNLSVSTISAGNNLTINLTAGAASTVSIDSFMQAKDGLLTITASTGGGGLIVSNGGTISSAAILSPKSGINFSTDGDLIIPFAAGTTISSTTNSNSAAPIVLTSTTGAVSLDQSNVFGAIQGSAQKDFSVTARATDLVIGGNSNSLATPSIESKAGQVILRALDPQNPTNIADPTAAGFGLGESLIVLDNSSIKAFTNITISARKEIQLGKIQSYDLGADPTAAVGAANPVVSGGLGVAMQAGSFASSYTPNANPQAVTTIPNNAINSVGSIVIDNLNADNPGVALPTNAVAGTAQYAGGYESWGSLVRNVVVGDNVKLTAIGGSEDAVNIQNVTGQPANQGSITGGVRIATANSFAAGLNLSLISYGSDVYVNAANSVILSNPHPGPVSAIGGLQPAPTNLLASYGYINSLGAVTPPIMIAGNAIPFHSGGRVGVFAGLPTSDISSMLYAEVLARTVNSQFVVNVGSSFNPAANTLVGQGGARGQIFLVPGGSGGKTGNGNTYFANGGVFFIDPPVPASGGVPSSQFFVNLAGSTQIIAVAPPISTSSGGGGTGGSTVGGFTISFTLPSFSVSVPTLNQSVVATDSTRSVTLNLNAQASQQLEQMRKVSSTTTGAYYIAGGSCQPFILGDDDDTMMVGEEGTQILPEDKRAITLKEGKIVAFVGKTPIKVKTGYADIQVSGNSSTVIQKTDNGVMRVANLSGQDTTVTVTRGGKIQTLNAAAGEELCIADDNLSDEELIPVDGVEREAVTGSLVIPGCKVARSRFNVKAMVDREKLLVCNAGSFYAIKNKVDKLKNSVKDSEFHPKVPKPAPRELMKSSIEMRVRPVASAPAQESAYEPISFVQTVPGSGMMAFRSGNTLVKHSAGSVIEFSHPVCASLLKGEMLVTAESPTRIKTPHSMVTVDPGSIALISVVDGTTKVRTIWGSAKQVFSTSFVDIPAGQESVASESKIALNNSISRDQVGRRKMRIIEVAGTDYLVHRSEISLVSLMQNSELLKLVLNSKELSDKIVSQKMVKMAAVLTQVTGHHGQYQQAR